LLNLFYTTKLEEESLNFDGYVKSMEAIRRRLSYVNLKRPKKLVILMTLMGLPPSFGPKKNSGISKDLAMEIIKKDLQQEALRLKAEQAQQPQGHLVFNLTREDSRRSKREMSDVITAQGL